MTVMRAIPQAGMPRLMFFVQHRLAQLQLTREALAACGGPAPSTLRKACREGRLLSARSTARLEAALGWQPGSAQRVMAGGSPSMRISEQVETASGRIDAVLGGGGEAGVRQTAAELRDFLMTVVERLEDFYTGPARAPGEVGDVGAC
jgi:hypothetical protein